MRSFRKRKRERGEEQKIRKDRGVHLVDWSEGVWERYMGAEESTLKWVINSEETGMRERVRKVCSIT